MDGTTQLAVAELVIYLIFVQFALFLLYKHGRHGLEGWFFLVTFCVLRIIAAALQINNWNKIKKGEPSSDTASIINSVGVSALLLCACGLIHEA
jgi:prolipoprotein diacylglyceryltransferase